MGTGSDSMIRQCSLAEVAMRARENDRSYGQEVMQEFLEQQRYQMMESKRRWMEKWQENQDVTKEEEVLCGEVQVI